MMNFITQEGQQRHHDKHQTLSHFFKLCCLLIFFGLNIPLIVVYYKQMDVGTFKNKIEV